MTFATILKQPSAFLPLVMSFAALWRCTSAPSSSPWLPYSGSTFKPEGCLLPTNAMWSNQQPRRQAVDSNTTPMTRCSHE